ncbi:MAG: FxsA family protein [Gammaproteobacteria bacterium]|nr:FxsA family protein [Gammaproteobacteria bacterium]
MPLLLILFIAIPILEIYLLLGVGGVIGTLPTVAAVVFTAILGAALVRRQGLATLGKVQNLMERGEMPATEILEGVAILLAGALLLTPGFFTDAIGFAALIPALRRGLIQRLAKGGRLGGLGARATGDPGPLDPQRPGRTLEGEFRNEDD